MARSWGQIRSIWGICSGAGCARWKLWHWCGRWATWIAWPKKLSGLDGYLLTEQLRAVERVRRDGAVCLRAAVFGLYPLVFLGIEFLTFHSLRSLAGYLLSLGFYLCYEAAQLRFRRKLRGLMNALEGGGF